MRIGWIISTMVLAIAVVVLGVILFNTVSRVNAFSSDIVHRVEYLEGSDWSNQTNIQDLYDMFAKHGYTVPASE